MNKFIHENYIKKIVNNEDINMENEKYIRGINDAYDIKCKINNKYYKIRNQIIKDVYNTIDEMIKTEINKNIINAKIK